VSLSLLLLGAGCTAYLQVEVKPSAADVYITDYPPSAKEEPVIYVAKGTAPFYYPQPYLAWQQYYVWASADGYEPQVRQIPNEIKVGPLVGAIFCLLPLGIWAYGPIESPVYLTLDPAQTPADADDALPLAPYAQDPMAPPPAGCPGGGRALALTALRRVTTRRRRASPAPRPPAAAPARGAPRPAAPPRPAG
jgi:hypothetical protein